MSPQKCIFLFSGFVIILTVPWVEVTCYYKTSKLISVFHNHKICYSKQCTCSKFMLHFKIPIPQQKAFLGNRNSPCWILTTSSHSCLGHFNPTCNSTSLSLLIHLQFSSFLKHSLKISTHTDLLFLNPLEYWVISDKVSFLRVSQV